MTLITLRPSFAAVKNYQSHQLEVARSQGYISLTTLLVKSSHRIEIIGAEVESFFKASDGEWFYVTFPWTLDGASATAFLADLQERPEVMEAYFAPIPKNATIDLGLEVAPLDLFAPTEDYESKQNYLKNSPEGVDATYAWELPGGTGKNVKVVDIEVCFEAEHEDFKAPFYVGANPACGDTNHGTAVWGEIAAKRDGKGVTGIAHESEFGLYGFIEGEWEDVNEQYIKSINEAIQGAIKNLDRGDVLVMEQQMVGPELKKYTAVEYWPHIFDQLKAATDKGIHCVAAAGNGDSNFDDASYEGAFDLSKRDSGCVMVGAVDATKNRLYFSNYGARVDAAGYGSKVLTTGYGDLFNGGSTRMYTARFSGTSSATPIVAGAVAVVSSIAKENKKELTPIQLRKLLRETGVVQSVSTANKRVGNFPSIKALVEKIY
jgi:subtilisin family serine protease